MRTSEIFDSGRSLQRSTSGANHVAYAPFSNRAEFEYKFGASFLHNDLIALAGLSPISQNVTTPRRDLVFLRAQIIAATTKETEDESSQENTCRRSVCSGNSCSPACSDGRCEGGRFLRPGQTVVQKATPQELKSVEDGDYYASSKTVVEQPTRQEQYQAREGDYYAPDSGK